MQGEQVIILATPGETWGRNTNCLAGKKNSSLNYNGIHSQHLFGVASMVDDIIQVVLKCFKQNSAIPVRLPDARRQAGIHIPTTILQKSVPRAQHWPGVWHKDLHS